MKNFPILFLVAGISFAHIYVPDHGMAATVTVTMKPGASGIVCLPPGNNPIRGVPTNLSTNPGWTNPNVKGFMIRDFWQNVEPTEGTYNFSFLDQAVTLAHQHGKFVGLSICAGTYT